MGDAKKRNDRTNLQTELDQLRGFRSHLADQVAGLYHKRAGVLEALLNTKATKAKFEASINPENAIGSGEILSLCAETIDNLEDAANWTESAIEPLIACYTDAGRALHALEGPAPMSLADVRAQAKHRKAPAPPVNPDDCERCVDAIRNDQTGAPSGCKTKPHPMPDGRCFNLVEQDPTAEGG